MKDITITGIAAWAHISKPSKESTFEINGRKKTIPSKYSIDVFLSPEDASKLHKQGFNVKRAKKEIPGIEDAVGKPYLQVKKPATYKSGDAVPPPVCVDTALNNYAGLIGNGSHVNVKLSPFEYEIMGKEGISARLLGVQVVALVEHKDKSACGFGVTDGFKTETVAVKDDDGFVKDTEKVDSLGSLAISADDLEF